MPVSQLSLLYPPLQTKKRELDALLAEVANPSDQSSVASQQRLAALSKTFAGDARRFSDAFQQEADRGWSKQESTLWATRRDQIEKDAHDFEYQTGLVLRKINLHKVEEDRKKLLAGAATQKDVDAVHALHRERSAMESAHLAIDQMHEQADRTVASIGRQNAILKTAQRRMLDLGASIGFSKTTVGVVTRRLTTDKWIVCGGIFVVSCFFVLLYYLKFYHGWSS